MKKTDMLKLHPVYVPANNQIVRLQLEVDVKYTLGRVMGRAYEVQDLVKGAYGEDKKYQLKWDMEKNEANLYLQGRKLMLTLWDYPSEIIAFLDVIMLALTGSLRGLIPEELANTLPTTAPMRIDTKVCERNWDDIQNVTNKLEIEDKLESILDVYWEAVFTIVYGSVAWRDADEESKRLAQDYLDLIERTAELIYDYRALVNFGEYGEKEYKKEVETGKELYATSKVVQFYKSQSPTLEE